MRTRGLLLKRPLCLLYIKFKYSHQVNWKNVGEKVLLDTTKQQYGDLAMFCFYLYEGTITIDEWSNIAYELSKTKQYEKLAYLLSYLHKKSGLKLLLTNDSYISCFTKLLTASATISLDDWLSYVCLSTDIETITVRLSFFHTYQYSSWLKYKQDYIASKQYYKVMLCHKMGVQLFDNDDTS
ncbi:unnamed protein product [Didymodactylos carnosus]|uniref:Uncharacterized protein n=1 Tax=Didymodactylos carnosus TaxID=1234261 RepID=A0A815NYH9_9BILA|nr:unnamed protein product [Didymodactylos carnosus]CAF4316230.1 unnamed protein product [Didymodactylos carnosus]